MIDIICECDILTRTSLPGTLILKMAYGYTTNTEKPDPLVALAEKVMAEIFSRSYVVEKWIVDFLPACS